MQFLRLLQPVLWLAYPVLIFLDWVEPRYVALVVISALLLRRRHQAQLLATSASRFDIGIVLALGTLAICMAITNSDLLLRIYPAAMTLGFLLVFTYSLKFPPSMVERFARLADPDLPPEGVRYTRRVTQVWCGFMAINFSIASYTAFWSSREIWSLYNGLISYLLMGVLFAGEWVYRQRMLTTLSTQK